jgi:hypothetical protein
MKFTAFFLAAALMALSVSTARACCPPETYTDQNGDKRHVRSGKATPVPACTRDSKKNTTNANERKIYDTDREKSLPDIGTIKLTNR